MTQRGWEAELEAGPIGVPQAQPASPAETSLQKELWALRFSKQCQDGSITTPNRAALPPGALPVRIQWWWGDSEDRKYVPNYN